MKLDTCSSRTVIVCTLWVIAAVTSACRDDTDLASIYSPQEWRDLFAGAGGWTPLPIPDSKYRPGSIIQVNDEGLRWIGDLESCRYPDEFTRRGAIPPISFSKSKVLDAGVLLNYRGIKVGPEFDRVKNVTLKVSEHSADALNLVALKVWQEVPANRSLVSTVCMDELEKPQMYLVTEAFTVSKGAYSLYDESDAKLKLTLPVLGPLLGFEGNVNYKITSDGDLEINEPAVFGIRKAVRIGTDFTVLGGEQDEPVVADSEIEALFFRTQDM